MVVSQYKSFNRNILNGETNNTGSVFYFTNNNANDIIISSGVEAYLGVGGGISGSINISEVMRRIQKLFKRGCEK